MKQCRYPELETSIHSVLCIIGADNRFKSCIIIVLLMNKAEYLTLMESMYSEVLENLKIEKIADYFSPSYEQTTAGEKIDYAGFVAHIKALKEHVESIQILPFEETIHEGNKIVLRYLSKITKKNGLISKFAVMAIFEIQGDKLIRCWELTKIILGEKQDEILDTIR
jgi:predicted SnoaL-like aldol condensation-catalyzing enzyme